MSSKYKYDGYVSGALLVIFAAIAAVKGNTEALKALLFSLILGIVLLVLLGFISWRLQRNAKVELQNNKRKR